MTLFWPSDKYTPSDISLPSSLVLSPASPPPRRKNQDRFRTSDRPPLSVTLPIQKPGGQTGGTRPPKQYFTTPNFTQPFIITIASLVASVLSYHRHHIISFQFIPPHQPPPNLFLFPDRVRDNSGKPTHTQQNSTVGRPAADDRRCKAARNPQNPNNRRKRTIQI